MIWKKFSNVKGSTFNIGEGENKELCEMGGGTESDALGGLV